MKRTRAVAITATCLLLLASPAGCGSKARQYASQARASYVSARAVLVGVQEFPSQIEELLRSEDLNVLAEDARKIIEDARNLLPSATSAFRAVKEKSEQLRGEGSDKFGPYAEDLLELVALNEQVINAYSEFIGLTSSALQGLPYTQDPQKLVPTVYYMDSTIAGIEELMGQIRRLESEAEALYQEITR